jgi:hypothetical protein
VLQSPVRHPVEMTLVKVQLYALSSVWAPGYIYARWDIRRGVGRGSWIFASSTRFVFGRALWLPYNEVVQ